MGTVLRITAIAAMLMTVVFAISVFGQAPPSDPKATVVEAIRKRAENHVDGGSPMQTQMVIDLFVNNASGLSKQEIADVYEQHYLKKGKQKKEDINLPEGLYSWLLAVISIIVAGLIGAFHKKVADLFSSLWERIYSRVAGMRLLRRVSLGKYRKSLIEEFTNVHIPFRPQRPLNLFAIFVPLKMSGASNRQTVDALKVFSSSRRLMIKGPPGSGKSMLLRKVALELAEGGFRFSHLRDAIIPIVLPLHRLAGEKSFNDHIVELLERNQFPRGTQFVSKALEKGWLFLLLDGLDEVAEHGRSSIVQEVKDFIQKYRDCRYAVTCRTAVYQGEFDDILTESFDILEFTDQQIWNFLQGWDRDLPLSKSITQLISALRDRPSIMALARNPLMLTIIAHLYCDTEYFILPHSRSEFYKESSDILLQRWQQDFNKFNPVKKRAILQDLAMWLQEKSQTEGADRRSGNSLEAQRRVQKQLPTLGIQKDLAEAVLNEIVERSGLLIRIDGGTRYQFAHLTLQEFLAAEKLQDDPAGLLERFRRDRTTWREVVKLWCGVSGDCTSLVKGVHELDRLTAFECIADARQIDPTLVALLIDDFKGELSGDGVTKDTLMAFGSVASAMHGRGAAVFAFLKATLENEVAPERRCAAAEALAMTNLPSAAEALGATLSHSNQFSEQLVRMGDLAVGALRAEAEKWNLSALDLLQQIGTPLATHTLLPFLWHGDDRVAARAAWSVGALLQLSEVETEIGNIRLTEQQRRAAYLDWIWAPFAEDAKPDLGIVAGRIAHLLALGKDDIVPAPPPRVDQRIALPILAVLFKNERWNTQEQLSLPDDIKNELLPLLSRAAEDTGPGSPTSFAKSKSAAAARKLISQVDSAGVLNIPSALELLLYLENHDRNITRLVLDAYAGAMSNCASALYKSLDLHTQLGLFRSRPSSAVPGEWKTLREIPDVPERWVYFWVSILCSAIILLAGLSVSKEAFTTFANFEWTAENFEWTATSLIGVAYFIYWILVGIMVFLPSLVYLLFEEWPPIDLDAVILLVLGPAIFSLLSPFFPVAVAQFALATYICHRPFWPFKRYDSGLIMVSISAALGIIGFPLVIYFALIGIRNLLSLFEVGGLLSAALITAGIVVMAMSCSQRMFYETVRSRNFFRQFSIAREERGPAVKLQEVLTL